MVFSSVTFLFLFLPITVLLNFICKNIVWKNIVLLLASLIFYSWGEPHLVLLMLAVTLVAYIGGLGIHRTAEKRILRKVIFIVTTILILSNLMWFKYFNFFADNVSVILGVPLDVPTVALPIGISFYTFQILSYVFDLYKGEVRVQRNFFYLALYLSFFPQLIAGPIVRYQTVEEEIHNRHETLEGVASGLRRFIVGLAKKVIIANNVARVAEIVYAGDKADFGTLMYWIAAISFALQIYFDFSGYSDMAIGLGKMFGFHFLENFNYPYISTSITDFWRRWHISLSTWFRDYIYIPMGGNRVGKLRHILNIFTVWAVTGFWHGASWNFIVWGIYYGVLLIIEKFLLKGLLNKLPRFIAWCYTMILVLIGWVIFNITDFSTMLSVLNIMFIPHSTDFVGVVSADSTILYGLLYLPLGLLCMLPISKKLTKPKSLLSSLICNIGSLLLFAVCLLYTFGSTYNPFIYFRF